MPAPARGASLRTLDSPPLPRPQRVGPSADSVRALLNPSEASGARAALGVELALLLDPDSEVVLGLAADREDAREGRHPAVQVPRDAEALGEHLAVGEIDGRRIVEPPGRTQLISEHGIPGLAARPLGFRHQPARIRECQARGPVVAEAG